MRLYSDVPIWMRPTDWEFKATLPSASKKRWNDEEVEQMVALKEQGYKLREIAEKLDRTFESVRHKSKIVGGRHERI